MSYYLLPSKNTSIEFMPLITDTLNLAPYISPSLDYYQTLLIDQINSLTDENMHSIDFFQKSVNSFEYIFTKVPGTKFSVAKLKPSASSFYIFLEISNILDLFECFQHKKISYLLHGPNAKSMNECIDILRENYEDSSVEMDDLINCKVNVRYIDFFYFELEEFLYNNKKNYVEELLFFLYNILQYQTDNGVSVIKVSSLTYKPILDIIYLMTSLYEKVYIVKPSVSDLCNSEKFIVCKNFRFSLENIQYYLYEIQSILFCIPKDKVLSSILKKPLPYYFLNKIEEANIIIGHQKLESMEQIINLIKNKNKEEKIESLKKANIQKCIQWCEKYKIPCNKFTEKINIFLNSVGGSEEIIGEESSLLYSQNDDSPIYR